MAIKNVERPFAITTSNSNSATASEETGTTADGRIVSVKTVTDDGAGNLGGGRGTIAYASRDVSARMVEFDRRTDAYKSDYEDAKDFNQSVADGAGKQIGAGAKGGSYTTASVGEEILAGSSVIAKYRVGAAAPRTVTRSFVLGPVVIDLCPYTTHTIVPGSVSFMWMGHPYEDVEGVVYRTSVTPARASGRLDYASGLMTMTDYVVGGTGPTDFQLLSLWTENAPFTTSSVFFCTEAAPIRPGAGGFVMTVVDTTGATLVAQIDGLGNITGPHTWGKIETSRGQVEVQYGDFLTDTSLTPAQKLEWWYRAEDVGAVQPGKVWRPWPVRPDTLRYSAVSYIYLPVDVSLMGLDPAALPADGKVAFARPGDTCVIGVNHGGPAFTASNGLPYSVGHERLSSIQVLDAATGAEIFVGFTTALDAGTVTFTDVSSYTGQVRVAARTEVYRQIAEVRIDGSVKLTQPVGMGFDVGTVFSTALRQGDRFARVSRVYDQFTWDKVTWADGLVGNQAAGEYNAANFPIEVTNRGAITERWALIFRSDGQNFDCYGQHLGLITAGNINTNFSPTNTSAGAPYFTLPAAGWGGGWVAGNTLFIDTVGAEFPIAIVRSTQPSSPVGLDDSVLFVQRGDVDRPPSTSF